SPNGSSAGVNLPMELFDPEWHPLVEALVALDGIEVDGGADVCEGPTPVGASVVEVVRDGRSVSLVDGRDPGAGKLVRLVEGAGGKAVTGRPDEVGETIGAVEQALEG
ncbi:MAG: hypothetical protein M3R38_31525, partial [Actinomycetota bacterium]|nr:hypothetical protein [Actinomycetota bacterium]